MKKTRSFTESEKKEKMAEFFTKSIDLTSSKEKWNVGGVCQTVAIIIGAMSFFAGFAIFAGEQSFFLGFAFWLGAFVFCLSLYAIGEAVIQSRKNNAILEEMKKELLELRRFACEIEIKSDS